MGDGRDICNKKNRKQNKKSSAAANNLSGNEMLNKHFQCYQYFTHMNCNFKYTRNVYVHLYFSIISWKTTTVHSMQIG